MIENETHSHSLKPELLAIENLRIALGGQELVRGVSLSVRPASVHCLVGDSGSGKTLTSLASIGLLPPGATGSGSIRLAGVDPCLLTVGPTEWSSIRGRSIGYIGQNSLGCLHPAYTIGFQLVEAIRRHQPLSKAEARAVARKELLAVDLQDPDRIVRQFPAQLSGGMCQRVALAIALCNRPSVLMIGGGCAAVAVVGFVTWWTLTHDPNALDLTQRFASPSWSSPLGTDELGRDMLSRVIAGGLITIGAASAALLATALIGTALGTLAAWHGKSAGSLLLVVTDSLVAVPEVVVALISVSIFGANLSALMIAVIAAGWLPFARLSFELASRVLGSDYAIAAQMSGIGPVRFIGNTLLPNIARPLIAHAFLRFPGKLLLLSGLSFLGLGPQPPTAEWGAMLARGVTELERHPLVPLVPGLAIVLTGSAAAHLGRKLEAPVAAGSAR